MLMDIENTMRFILDTQAKLEASAQMHDERLARIEGLIAHVEGLSAQIGNLVEANTSRIAQLVDVCLSLARHAEESDRRMQAGFDELREIQANTEYKLNALIETVDKIVRRDGDKSA
jgi:ABC-type transporter Mla subunit MlaD